MRRHAYWLSLVFIVMLSLSGCATDGEGDFFDDEGETNGSGAGGIGSGGNGSVGGGSGSGGDTACADDVTAPSITSSITDVLTYAPGAGGPTYTLTFDEDVEIAAGGITVSGGGMVSVSPALPAVGSSFDVTVTGLPDDGYHELTIVASSIEDTCGNALAADAVIDIAGPCEGNVDPPVVTSNLQENLASGTMTHTYVLTFDEVASIDAGGITVSDGAIIDSITPPLPAASDSFSIELSNLTAGHTITVAQTALSDGCGNDATEDVNVAICTGNSSGTTTFNFTGAIESWTVPACPVGAFTIEVWGAEGGSHATSTTTPGLGARMKGDFILVAGETLKILVGENPGTDGNGGGGGSFVTQSDDTPLIIAGGGGGSSQTSDSADKHGSILEAGNPGAGSGGLGGLMGNGGNVGSTSFNSGGGGGLLTNGLDGSSTGAGGIAFVNGGTGTTTNADGGFGGGGSGSLYVVGGGGGGYSGGGGGGNSSAGVGGGGGSFNSGMNPDNTAGVRSGHGMIVITW